mmetsp:Transcript_20071/g.23119  ORF Transcript_20071/g.23119 Transcript_20071/m.23119 type:complete len:98 (-) Transcript_20071:36-329(-)
MGNLCAKNNTELERRERLARYRSTIKFIDQGSLVSNVPWNMKNDCADISRIENNRSTAHEMSGYYTNSLWAAMDDKAFKLSSTIEESPSPKSSKKLH